MLLSIYLDKHSFAVAITDYSNYQIRSIVFNFNAKLKNNLRFIISHQKHSFLKQNFFNSTLLCFDELKIIFVHAYIMRLFFNYFFLVAKIPLQNTIS